MPPSTSETEKSEWLVYVPDLPDAQERRTAVFPQHVQRMKSDPQDFWVFGGATLKDRVIPGQPPHITGSGMLIFASSREAVLARLRDDPLVRERVWDIANAQVHPFFRPKRGPV
ncbi:hypothetical protein NM208_g15008 [Fusarium decemcellulare]|uniref:Uncharacterized protein n=1 Tax=Fusarium decemcellulare TaxID=57161 RepID=A0ACC1REA9_9HYPO|nr:hypothetical protein NM208_g15008 [Fusarium decemcellulare]